MLQSGFPVARLNRHTTGKTRGRYNPIFLDTIHRELTIGHESGFDSQISDTVNFSEIILKGILRGKSVISIVFLKNIQTSSEYNFPSCVSIYFTIMNRIIKTIIEMNTYRHNSSYDPLKPIDFLLRTDIIRSSYNAKYNSHAVGPESDFRANPSDF